MTDTNEHASAPPPDPAPAGLQAERVITDDDQEKAHRQARGVSIGATILTVVYSISAIFAFLVAQNGNPIGADWDGFGASAIYAAVLAVVCAGLALAGLMRARWVAIVLCVVFVFYWIDWIATIVLGLAFSVPWLPAIGTFYAFRGTRAVFRYRRLTREGEKDVSRVFA